MKVTSRVTFIQLSSDGIKHRKKVLRFYPRSSGWIYDAILPSEDAFSYSEGNMLSLTILVLLTVIRFSQSTLYSCDPSASCGCSQNSAAVNRIVGGENAAAATWGWAVSLAINKNSLCGGSIISSSWIITAAHCTSGVSPSKITVYAGSEKQFSGSQTRVASQIIVQIGRAHV